MAIRTTDLTKIHKNLREKTFIKQDVARNFKIVGYMAQLKENKIVYSFSETHFN